MKIKIANNNSTKSWIHFGLVIVLILVMFAITMICAMEKVQKNQQKWDKETKGAVSERLSNGD